MAESRRCGYCREVGHQVRHCVTKQGERDLITKFMFQQPIDIYKALCNIGLGEGAMVKYDGGLAQVLPYDTPVNRTTWGGTQYRTTYLARMIVDGSDLITYKNVKYSKQVRFLLNSPMPEGQLCTADRYHRNGQYVYVEIPVLLLSKGGAVTFFRCSPNGMMFYHRHKDKGNWENQYGFESGKREYERVMVDPSYSCPELIIPQDIRDTPEEKWLHKRLL